MVKLSQGMWKMLGGIGAIAAGYMLISTYWTSLPSIPINGIAALIAGILSAIAGYMLLVEY